MTIYKWENLSWVPKLFKVEKHILGVVVNTGIVN